MADTSVTIVGNVTRDPELKFLQSGQAAVNFSVAVSRRWQNRQTQEWEEKTSYFDVQCYGQMAENAANSIAKGTRVVVTGQLEQRSWETEDGRKGSKVEIRADEIATSLRWATAKVNRNERVEGGRSFNAAPTPSPASSTNHYDEEPF
jgi:single-strand DNA-binding protein